MTATANFPSTGYYGQLIDVDFFGRQWYDIEVNDVKLRVWPGGRIEPGVGLSQELFLQIFDCIANYTCHGNELFLCDQKTVVSKLCAFYLVDEAFRQHNAASFFDFIRFLEGVHNEKVNVRIEKMEAAWRLREIVNDGMCYDTIRTEALGFLTDNSEKVFSVEDILVEVPVRGDFLSRNVDLDNPASLEAFYRNTMSYILELTAANHQVETLFNYDKILACLMDLGVSKVFDYAAGIGTFAIIASRSGFEVRCSELESFTMAFAKQRVADRGLPIEWQTVPYNEYIIPSGQECIVCTEILEHVYNPEALISAVRNALVPDGVFVVSESFNYTEDFCTHLPKHKGRGGEIFKRFMRKQGFSELRTYLDIHPTIWLKK